MSHPQSASAWSTTKRAPKTATVSGKNFYKLSMQFLIGCRITAVGQDEEGFLLFECKGKGPDGADVSYCVEVSQDEEGNGPGFLFGVPNPHEYYGKGDR
tara:strand:- start:725 stop:1021 length:297 start_codon:yes stop_codon:yes gene_type:complete